MISALKNLNAKHLLFLILAVVAFSSIGVLNYEYTLDDELLTSSNRLVLEGVGAWNDLFTHGYVFGAGFEDETSYRPMTLLSFSLENSVFGVNPIVSHLFSLILYLLSGALVFLFLIRTLVLHEKIALVITALFMFHPVHSEIVASVKSRDELLHFIFGLFALISFIQASRNRDNKWFVFSSILFLFAFLSKETALSYVPLIVVLSYFTLEKINWKHLALVILPSLSIYLLLRMNAVEMFPQEEKGLILNNVLFSAESTGELWASKLYILLKYLLWSVWPQGYSWDHSYADITISSWKDWSVWTSLFVHLGIVTFALLNFKKKSLLSLGLIFFLITLAIPSNFFILINTTAAERLLFAPTLGLIIFFVVLFNEFRLSWNINKLIVYALITVLLFGSAYRFHEELYKWESNETLFKSGIERSPKSVRALFALAKWYEIEGDGMLEQQLDPENSYRYAIKYYKEGVALYDGDIESVFNIALLYQKTKEYTNAKQWYEKCLHANAEHIKSINNLGTISYVQNDFKTAIDYFKRTIELDEKYFDGNYNLARVYHSQGDLPSALRYYQNALMIDERNMDLLKDLHTCLLDMGNDGQANALKAQIDNMK